MIKNAKKNNKNIAQTCAEGLGRVFWRAGEANFQI
jgi:hypothetical protein